MSTKIASISLIVGLVFGMIGMAPQAVAAPMSTTISASAVSAVSASTKPASKVITSSKAQTAKAKKAAKIKANTKKRSVVTNTARTGAKKRVQYRWGGSSLRGWDCSGLVSYAYKKAGVKPKNGRWTTRSIKTDKRFVRTTKPKAGDIVYQGTYHVGIYTGVSKKRHMMVSARNPRADTTAHPVYNWNPGKVSFYTLRT